MAGLLDIFGSSPDIYAGLLGEEGMAQAKRQAQSDALLNLSAALMKAGAPSRTPQGLGLGLVEGMQAASKGYKESMQGALQEKLAQQKIAEAIAAKKRAAGAQFLLESALQPKAQTYSTVGTELGPDNVDVGGGWSPSGITSQAPQAVGVRSVMPNMQDLAGQFAKYGTEGLAALKTYQDVLKSGRPETVTLGEGQQLFERQPDGSLKVVGQGGEKLTSDMQGYRLAQKEGFKGSFMDYQTALKKAGATNINMPSAEERKGGLYLSQMNDASNVINKLGIDESSTGIQSQMMLAGTPGAGLVISPEVQQYDQAKRQWSEAYLRVKTGAAATPGEVENNMKTYFPIYGEGPEAVKRKAEARAQAERDMGIVAGRATPKEQPKKPAPVTLTLPDGRKVNFKSKAEADAFRKDAGF